MRVGRQLEIAIGTAVPSPVDVEEVSLPVAIDDDLMTVAASDDRSILCQFLINHFLPFPLRHQRPSRHANVLVVAEEA